MITRKVVPVTTNEEEISSAICDWCGQEVLFDKIFVHGGIIRITFEWGSKHDGSIFEGCICDDCFEKELSKRSKKVPN